MCGCVCVRVCRWCGNFAACKCDGRCVRVGKMSKVKYELMNVDVEKRAPVCVWDLGFAFLLKATFIIWFLFLFNYYFF